MELIAHRGLSGVHPESTRAAYLAAIAVAEQTGRRIELECDTHFSADGVLVIQHDHSLRRTAGRDDLVHDLTVAQLKQVDFGSWRVGEPDADQRSLITLAELFDLVHAARDRGVPVGLAVETKHPNPRGLEVDEGVAALLAEHGWDGADSPARMISFHLPAVEFAARRLPHLRRTLLIMTELGDWAGGDLPYGTDTVGIDLELLRTVPEFAQRVLARDNRLHVWTVNEPDDVSWCLELGASGLTSDRVDQVVELVDAAVS